MRRKSKKLLGASTFAITLALSNVAVYATTTPVAYAAQEATGTWGSCKWQLYADGTLRVGRGTGRSEQSHVLESRYTQEGKEYRAWVTRTVSPWREYASEITTVRFEEDVVLPIDSSYLFEGCSNLTSIQGANPDATNLANARGMFLGCSSLQSSSFIGCDTAQQIDLSKWKNVANLQDMSNMFKGCSALTTVNLINWITDNVTDMSGMFDGCSALSNLILKDEKDNSRWNTLNVTNMTAMFKGCSSLKKLDFSSPEWSTWNVTASKDMFAGCALDKFQVGANYKLQSVDMAPVSTAEDGMWWSDFDLVKRTNEDIFNVANPQADIYTALVTKATDTNAVLRGTWGNCKWELQPDGTLTVHYGTGNPAGANPWENANQRIPIKVINFDAGVKLPSNVSNLFAGLTALESVNITGAETSSITDLSSLFKGCTSLKAADLSTWNVSKVTNMREMFRDCSSLTELDLSKFNTAKLQDMSLMFKGCSSLATLNLQGWNTSSVSTIPVQYIEGNFTKIGYATFDGCTSLATFIVGTGYDTKGCEDLFPNGDEDGSWYSTNQKKRFTKTEIVSKRSKVADIYTKAGEEQTAKPEITNDHSMTLSSNISVNFYADVSAVPADQRGGISMVFTLPDGTSKSVPFEQALPDGEVADLYFFKCPLNTLQVADPVTASLIWNGESIATNTYSLDKYMDLAEKKGDAKLKDLVHATKDYAHYAQATVPGDGYKHVAMPFNEEMTTAKQNSAKSAVSSYGCKVENLPASWSIGISLNLESTISLNAYFTLPSGVSPTNAKLDGKDCSVTKTGTNTWVVVIPSINATDLDKPHTIELTAGGKTVKMSNVSALSWSYQILNSGVGTADAASAASVYYYNQAAKAY